MQQVIICFDENLQHIPQIRKKTSNDASNSFPSKKVIF